MTHPNDALDAFAVMPDANDTPEAFKDWVRSNWQAIEAALTQKPPVIEGLGDAAQTVLNDNARMRKAGTVLAEAALYVIREFDGTHRLSLAVSEWSKAIADEGGRAPTPPQESVDELKRRVWKAVQHPHDGSLHGIDQKQRGVEQAIDYLAATHNISKKS